MKALKSIKLVQFYLFEKEDLPISRVCGIFGPNGSGKSAFIDAVQIAMTGGHHQYMAFNAQADETKGTSRSIRSYCLGQTGDAEAGRVRDAATTYITLVWEDEATGVPTSMGICITTNAATEGHVIEGRYLLPGIELSLPDHLEEAGRHQRPQEWKVFRKLIEQRAKREGIDEDVVFTEPLRFVRAFLTALRGTGAIPHAESFMRAFRFGLKMRFDKSVDEIVRYQVLEQRNTNIRRFKEVMESFRNLHNRVIEVEEKIRDAEGVAKHYQEAARLSSQVATWEALAAKAKLVHAETGVSNAEGKLQAANDALESANSAKAKHAKEVSGVEDQAKHYETLAKEHGAHSGTQDLQARISRLDTDVTNGQASLVRDIGSVRQALLRVADKPPLNPQEVDVDVLLDRLGGLLTVAEPPSLDEVIPLLDPALTVLKAAFDVASGRKQELNQERNQLRTKLNQAKENLQRVRSGKPPLDNDVLAVQRALADSGIPSTPVCDLVSVRDISWQPVIEAYLASHREALFIEKPYEERAFTVYRRLESIYGVKLVRESRHSTRDRPVKGSIAELLVGEHPAAVEYLRSQFGRTMQADSDDEATSGERTLTRDGMLSGRTFDRLRPTPAGLFRLGASNREAQRDELMAEVTRLERAIPELSSRIDTWQEHCEAFAPFVAKEKFKQDVAVLLQQIHRLSEQMSLAQRQFEDSADEDYVRLVKLAQEWREKLSTLRVKTSPLDEAVGGAKIAVSAAEEDLVSRRAEYQAAEARHTVAAADPAFDDGFARKQWDELFEIKRLEPLAIFGHAEQARRDTDKEQRRHIENAGRLLEGFRIRHSISLPDETYQDWRKANQWVIKHIDLLRSSELENYKEQMEEALRTSQETFRNDVALAINNNLDWLHGFLDRLNSVLEKAPAFSNGERYRFLRSERKEHSGLLHFIRDVKQWGPQNDLIGAGEMPDAFRRLLEEGVGSADSARGPLDDYREFYDFDIEIYRRSADGSRDIRGRLSRRIGTGSGGEHKAPLYVIAGAALANAYHLSPTHRDGLGIIVLDEAFNKMDPNNITATMQYLDDLGMQVMMASPGENLGTLTAFLHSYFDIIRDAETNVVQLSHREVSEKTRELFRSDLLEFHPDLLAREIEAMQASRGGMEDLRG